MYLWSGTLSVFSAKVRIALCEKGLTAEIGEVPWSRGGGWQKPQALLAVSPRGQVPVLVDGDLAVFDSTVIGEYLEERFPDEALMPTEAAARASCRMWEDLGDDVLTRAMPVLVREVFLKPDGAGRDEAAVAAAIDVVTAHHRRLDAALAGKDYLCGRYSLADIGNFLALAFCGIVGAPPDDGLSELHAWYQRVSQRSAVKAEMDAIGQAVAAA